MYSRGGGTGAQQGADQQPHAAEPGNSSAGNGTGKVQDADLSCG